MEDLIQKTESSSLFSDNEIKKYLLETAKWGKFLAIMGYIGIAFLILLGIFMMLGFSFLGLSKWSHTASSVGSFSFVGVGLLYIIMALIYLLPTKYLYRFSEQMKNGLNLNNSASVTSSFSNLKSLFKFLGIFTIVILSIYVLIIVAVIAFTFISIG